MPDKTCDVCGVPKPEICFEHGEARAKRPCHVDTCQSCLRDLRHNARARYGHSAKGRATAKRAQQRYRMAHPDKFAAAYAAVLTKKDPG